MPGNWDFTALGAFFGAVGFAVAVFRYIVGIRETLSSRMLADKETLNTRIATEAEKASNKIDAVVEQTRLMIESVREAEARSRNELSTALQAALAEVRRDTRALDEKVTSMRVEMVRRSDLTDAVNGLMGALDRQEKRFEVILAKTIVPARGVQ
jgi:hypothetical protein